MVRKIISFSLLLLMTAISIEAQNRIELMLDSVKKNNPSLQAARLQLAKQEVGFKTGLTLPNPEIEYNYMFPESGSQGVTELVASQPFDFPTKYLIQNKLAKSNIESAKLQYKLFEQEFLLQAKYIYLELIFFNKTNQEFEQRLNHAKVILDSYEKMAKQGESNRVELNKIKLFYLSMVNEVANSELAIKKLTNHLAELNNGNWVRFDDTIYPIVENIDDFEAFKAEYLGADLEVGRLQTEREIANRELKLSRTNMLPSFAAGYKMTESPAEQLNGLHLGLTIPLWEHKNKIKHAKANMAYSGYKISETQHVKSFELKSLYDSYISKKQLLEQYAEALKNFNNKQLLDLSLKTGNISVIEYLTELSMVYETLDNYLAIEKEYHLTVAELIKYKL